MTEDSTMIRTAMIARPATATGRHHEGSAVGPTAPNTCCPNVAKPKTWIRMPMPGAMMPVHSPNSFGTTYSAPSDLDLIVLGHLGGLWSQCPTQSRRCCQLFDMPDRNVNRCVCGFGCAEGVALPLIAPQAYRLTVPSKI